MDRALVIPGVFIAIVMLIGASQCSTSCPSGEVMVRGVWNYVCVKGSG